jgi:hypothetical protein
MRRQRNARPLAQRQSSVQCSSKLVPVGVDARARSERQPDAGHTGPAGVARVVAVGVVVEERGIAVPVHGFETPICAYAATDIGLI